MQLDALENSVSHLIDINESVISVEEAIANLAALQAPQQQTTEQQQQAEEDRREERERNRRMEKRQEKIEYALTGLFSLLKRNDRGGAFAMVTDDDSPIKTESAS